MLFRSLAARFHIGPNALDTLFRSRFAVSLIPVMMTLLACFWKAGAEPAPATGPRRIEVLFLGSENRFNHDPIARFRVIRKALGPEGINFTYSGTLDVLTPANLANYDVLLIFANHDTIGDGQKQALLEFSRHGGGCVLLHCAAGCFRESDFDAYVDLLGARFKSHETAVFRAEIVNHEHPVMKGWEGFKCWDETYVHQRHAEDRVVLQERDGEPWTWVKTYGQGRVFYTASGHDHRCWDLPAYHDLIDRAIRWTAGDETAKRLADLELPELSYRPAAVPKDPDNPVGPLNEIQHPLSPEQSLKLAQVPPGFELALFASEPEVVNPIAINWDHRGRLWVVEAFDYPHKAETDNPQDRIKILEDTDGDGRADQVTLFAEGLNICTTVLPCENGAIATDGRNMVFLRDVDGDDRADEKRVIFSGIKLRDTHACTSNLRHGFDNWIYATVGYSGIDTTVAGKRWQTEMGVFRFKADGSAFEVLQNTTNNTWGLAFTEEGNVVGSTANGNPSWYVAIPNRYYAAVALEPKKAPRADDHDLLYPITTDYFQNNPKEEVSSGAGHAVYTGRRFPNDWWNRRAFICEPPLHLVAAPRLDLLEDGYRTTHFETNLYASADAWSAPVAAECGPDGAVWIADWYNPICNHNPYRSHQELGPGNAFRTDDRDRSHGRIYRIFPHGSSGSPYPRLDTAKACVEALGHPDLFWRLTAQRRLVERQSREMMNALVEKAADLTGPRAALHAFLTLAAVGERPPGFDDMVRRLAESEDQGLVLAALPELAPDGSQRDVAMKILNDPARHAWLRRAAALHLVTIPSDAALGEELAALWQREPELTDHLATAVRLAALRHPEGVFRRLAEGDASDETPQVNAFLETAAKRLADDEDWLSDGLLAFLAESGGSMGERLSSVAGPSVSQSAPELSAAASRGRDVYFACIACHQPDGRGLEKTFPPLDGSERVHGDERVLIKIVLKGLQGPYEAQGEAYNGVMPGHETTLTDEQIADVLTYIREAWSNEAPAVRPESVGVVRQAVADRDRPWTIDELP